MAGAGLGAASGGRGARRRALALGLLHGPAELLPISSSAHVTLAPWLAGRGTPMGSPALDKSLEVALHLGSAAALAVSRRREVVGALRRLDRRTVEVLALSCAVPAACGLALEGPIERRLGTPGGIAAALGIGAIASLAADRGRGTRTATDAGRADGFALGVAQALALIPGVSRRAATLAAARRRGFRRRDADLLSRQASWPVVACAGALRGARLVAALARGDAATRAALPALAVGGAAAFASAAAAEPRLRDAGRRSPLPWAAYRLVLAAVTIRRLRQTAGR